MTEREEVTFFCEVTSENKKLEVAALPAGVLQ